MRYDKDDGGLGWNKICGAMSMSYIERREDKIRHNGWDIVDSVPLRGMAAAVLVALFPSPAKHRRELPVIRYQK